MDEAEYISGNGKTGKYVRTSEGTISVNTPRNRNPSFEPELIRKRETILAESLEPKIIGMYGFKDGPARYLEAHQGYVR